MSYAAANGMMPTSFAAALAMQSAGHLQQQGVDANAAAQAAKAELQCPVCNFAATINVKKRLARFTKQRKRNPLHRHCASFGYDGMPW